MKTFAVAILALAAASEAFTASNLPSTRSGLTVSNAYVPDGFTPESYKKFKEAENKKKATKNLGKLGPRGFQSRSFQSFQEALERGEASHLMPVFNAKEKVRKGEIKREDIPYMQRGGSWDNSDVRGAKKVNWLKSDKSYASGGYKKEQSVSVFGYGEGLDWSGKQGRTGPSQSIQGKAVKFPKGYKAPNVNQLNGEKKFFGLF